MDGSFALKFAVITLFVLMIPQASESLSLGAEVGGTVNGSVSWINITENPVQIIDFYWMNTGSSTCMVRGRMDFFDHENKLVYSAWSGEKPMISGSEDDFRIIAKLPSGIYRAFLRTYQCNEIIENGPYIFEITPSGSEGGIEITGVRTYENTIEISVKSDYDAYVIPERYQLGWIVESGMIPTGSTSKEIGYDPGVWIKRNITFVAVSEDGEHFTRRTFSLEREIKGLDTLVYIIILGLLISGAIMLFSKRYNR